MLYVGCTNRYRKGFPQGVSTFISKGWGGRISDIHRYRKGFPQGVSTFISKGWGGRISDIHLTENWYFGEPTTR